MRELSLSEINAQAALLWARWQPFYKISVPGCHPGHLMRTYYSPHGLLVADYQHPVEDVVETWGVRPSSMRSNEVEPCLLGRRYAKGCIDVGELEPPLLLSIADWGLNPRDQPHQIAPVTDLDRR
jgi:hypothetical protein